MVVRNLVFSEGFINDMLTVQVLKEGAEFDSVKKIISIP